MSIKFQDYYEILDVKRDATQKEIKSAYHKLARKWHPDLHTGQDKEAAEEKIKKINEAYEVLSDPDKRAKYDRLGANWQGGQDFQPPPNMDGFEFYTGGAGAGDFSDFFEMLFGGGGFSRRNPFGAGGDPFAGARRAQRGPVKGQDVEAELDVALEDVHHGAEKSLQLSVGRELKTLTVKIPKGINNGSRIRLKGQGGEGFNGGEKGDLYLKISIQPHPRYKVECSDLEAEITLRPEQAVLGDDITISTLEGQVSLKIPPMIRAGKRLRLKAKGLNSKDSRGDLYVKIKIDIPESLSPEAEDLYRRLKELS
ncbi:MAG TPA: J domain-containing protein [Verrucomicrobiae bacterium]|nr:J domain-containing protein [Verrucomicrobiae bacterium]